MRRSFRLGHLLPILIALTAAGCEDTLSQLPTTRPDPVPVTDTFTGTLTANGGVTFPFTASTSGRITLTLTEISDVNVPIGISLGTWTGIACQIVLARDGAAQGSQVVGQASNFGNLCARVYDIGNVVDPITFTITVVHP